MTPGTSVVRHRSRPVLFAAVATLLALHWVLAVGSKQSESTTADELAHLTGGFTYWQFNDYRIQPENGNLPQRWAALPAWMAGTKFPELNDSVYWKTSDAWVLGHQFFYETGDDHFPRLMMGRAMIALFSVATGLLVFLWSQRLFGTAGGFVSLTFFVFSPTFLAHGALVTSDVCMTFFFLAAVGAYWRHLQDFRFGPWLLSALVFALACVAKFSAVLLLPMMLLLAMVRTLAATPLVIGSGGRTREYSGRAAKLGWIALSTLGHGVAAVVVIWAFFGFRYSAFNPALPPADHFIRPWEVTLNHVGHYEPVISALRAWHALPEAFLYGFSFVVEMSQFRAAFLDGAYSTTGWYRFFPLAFLYKSTLPLLISSAAIVVIAVRSVLRSPGAVAIRSGLYRFAPLLVLFGVYWAVSLVTKLNIGHRHIMPTYPVLFIFAGVLGAGLSLRRPFAAIFVAGLLAWQAIDAVRVFPDYIAYFNPASGGMAKGHTHLVDSSCDWGQDLPGLKQWLAKNAGTSPVYLSYAGSGEPAYYSISGRRLPFINGFKISQPYVKLEPGIYCIGATPLEHVYSPIRGDWTPELEKEYQSMHALEPVFAAFASDPKQRAVLLSQAPATRWHSAWARHDLLRFARLCHYLRARQPDADIGHSILIYRLSADELRRVVDGSYDDWKSAVESAAKATH